MNETKFTPGPWKSPTEIQSCLDETSVYGADGLIVAALTYDSSDFRPEEENFANAQLIAAAPDLYADLSELTVWWANWMPDAASSNGGYGALEKARAALAKARGEESK